MHSVPRPVIKQQGQCYIIEPHGYNSLNKGCIHTADPLCCTAETNAIL